MINNQADCEEDGHAEELVKLKALKSGLMTGLLSGRVRVPEASEASSQITGPIT